MPSSEREARLLPSEVIAGEERRLGLRIHDEEARLHRAEPDMAERKEGERIVVDIRRRFAAIKAEAESDLAMIDIGKRPMAERITPAPETNLSEKALAEAKVACAESEKLLAAEIARITGWTGRGERYFMDKLQTIARELENAKPNMNERALARRLAAEDVIWSRVKPALLYAFFTARRKYRHALAEMSRESPAILERGLSGVAVADELPEDLELTAR